MRAQIQVERQRAEAERIAHSNEMARLQQQLDGRHPSNGQTATQSRTYVLNGQDSRAAAFLPPPTPAVAPPSSAASWLNPLGYIGYWFGGGSGGGGGGNGSSGDTIIIKV